MKCFGGQLDLLFLEKVSRSCVQWVAWFEVVRLGLLRVWSLGLEVVGLGLQGVKL